MLKQSDNFTAVRLILALLVVLSHSFPVVGQIEPMLFGRSMGNFAVHGFFTVSGYLVAGSFLSTTPGSFVFRRFIRIVPGYVTGFIFGAVAISMFNGYLTNPYPGSANGPLWTIIWEVTMYAGVFVVGVVGLLKPQSVGTLWLVGLILACVNINAGNNGIDVIAPLAIVFLGGVFVKTQEQNLPKFVFPGAFLALMFLYLPGTSHLFIVEASKLTFGFGWHISILQVRVLLYLLLMPFGMIYVCRYFPISTGWKSDYSYGVYVYAWPIQQMTVAIFIQQGWHIGPHTVFATASCGSLLMAAASWHLMEKQALRLKKWTLRKPALRNSQIDEVAFNGDSFAAARKLPG